MKFFQLGKKSTFNDLCCSGLFGENPNLGWMMFIFGAAGFAFLTFNYVCNGPLVVYDLWVEERMHAIAIHCPRFVINLMIFGYHVGYEGMMTLAVGLEVYFFKKRHWREFVTVLVAFGMEGVLFLGLSNLLERPRPFTFYEKPVWNGSKYIPGFPSGHSLALVICLGFLVYLLVPRINSAFGKYFVTSLALFLVLYVGFSRIFLGDHFLTDVIAGYSLGIAWLGFSCTCVELWFKKHRS